MIPDWVIQYFLEIYVLLVHIIFFGGAWLYYRKKEETLE